MGSYKHILSMKVIRLNFESSFFTMIAICNICLIYLRYLMLKYVYSPITCGVFIKKSEKIESLVKLGCLQSFETVEIFCLNVIFI